MRCLEFIFGSTKLHAHMKFMRFNLFEMHEIVQKNRRYKPIVEFPFVKVHPLHDSHPNMLKMCEAKEG